MSQIGWKRGCLNSLGHMVDVLRFYLCFLCRFLHALTVTFLSDIFVWLVAKTRSIQAVIILHVASIERAYSNHQVNWSYIFQSAISKAIRG